MGVNATIRKLRKHKKITLDKLATLTGLTKGYLSKVERAPKAPPFSTLELIARALAVDVSGLLEPGKPVGDGKDIDLTRAEERVPEAIGPDGSGEGCAFVPLLRSHQGKYMSPLLLTLEPGGKAEFQHDAEEFVYVLSGQATMTYNGEEHELRPDDSFYLDSRRKHRFENRGDAPATLLSVSFNYRRF